ncbi:hypothetical protein K7W03_22345, partial [Sphingobium sp. PNB]|uniref:hypothetical protein n=1 Tax=Sphingobium sp. PNB TaxID=863934 RepID=UPI001CA3A516
RPPPFTDTPTTDSHLDCRYARILSVAAQVKAEIDDRDFWTPSDDGQRLIITPLEEGGQIVDLIAFDIKTPDVWYLRTGNGFALGAESIEAASHGWGAADQRLILHATPMDWLRSSCFGACVTQWTAESRAAVRQVPAIDVGSPKFARALRLELTRPPRIPEIEVKGMQSRAA